jgi:hypothetical protein
MATVNYSVTEVPGDGFIVKWPAMATGDVGQPFNGYGGRDRSVQFDGAFGGATVTLKGSNFPVVAGASWIVLTDPQGNGISKTGPDFEAISEAAARVRPEVAGGAAAAIDVYMFIGGSR